MRVPAEAEGCDRIRTEVGVEPVRCTPAALSFPRGEEWGMEFMLESFLRIPCEELTPLTMPVVVVSKGTGTLGRFKKR